MEGIFLLIACLGIVGMVADIYDNSTFSSLGTAITCLFFTLYSYNAYKNSGGFEDK